MKDEADVQMFRVPVPRKTDLVPPHSRFCSYVSVRRSVSDSSTIDFLAFLILDINTRFATWFPFAHDLNPSVVESLPVGTRILAAIMQSAAVRTEGFAIVSLSGLVPAVQ